MSFAAAAARIRELSNQHVRPAVNAAAGATLPFYIDNRASGEASGAHVRLSVLHGGAPQSDMGAAANLYRYQGVATWSLFVEFDSGDEKLLQMADAVVAAVRPRQTYNGVVLSDASTIRVGRAGKFWQMNVTYRWTYDSFA